MRVNRKGIENLRQETSIRIQNFSKKAVPLTFAAILTLGSFIGVPIEAKAAEVPQEAITVSYAYVPYNPNWGNQEANHLEKVRVGKNGVCVVDKEDASKELLAAIYDCIGEKRVQDSRYDLITFRLIYEEGEDTPIIDRDSFAIYKKRLSTLRPFHKVDAYLKVKIFMSPEGQQWVDEKNYSEYASGQWMVYQCSDGSLAHSYEEYKAIERELAYRPHHPNYPTYPECTSTLEDIGYLELGSDGTVWRDQTMLEEYLAWRQDPTVRMKDGVYYGVYGTAINFETYASIYNAGYFINAGLRRQEQFYGAHGFLYSSAEKAALSIDLQNGYQKVKTAE